MAQLHRRIRRVSHSALALAALWVGAVVPADARAQAGVGLSAELSTTEGEIAAWAGQLASADAAERQRAARALAGLEAEALPAIRARVATFRSLDPDASYDALRSFRHVLGSRRADDMIDIAPGVPRVLEESRDEVTVAMAERVLLVRSLERIGTLEAGRTMADVFATDTEAWRWEMRRVVDRMGARLLPALVVLRSHDDRRVRSWARSTIEDLGMEQPGLAIQQEDNALLADLLRAYGEQKDMDAMPVVVSFTTHDRAQVRAAARWATEQYGQNAIWQLRRVLRNLTEQDADRSWGWRRTMEELYGVADARRLDPVREELSAGKAALAAGDLDAVRERFDAVLRRAPGLPSRGEMAPGYAALAARELAADRLDEAARLYRRAERLAPDHPNADAWRAELAFIEGEQSLSRGVADLGSYERALALHPGHARAARAVALLSGEEAAGEARTRRWAAAVAAALLVLAVFLLLRRRRGAPADPAEPAAEPLDTAPDTLPG